MNWYRTQQYKQGEWSWKAFLTPPLISLILMLGLTQLDVQNLFSKHNGNPVPAQKELAKQVQQTETREQAPSEKVVEPETKLPIEPTKKKFAPEEQKNKALSDMISRHEGNKNRRYFDSKKIPTIGIGFNLRRSDARKLITDLGANYNAVLDGKQVLTPEQIDTLFHINLEEAMKYSKQQIPNFYRLPSNVQHIIVDMMFNLGPNRFAGFRKFKRALARNDFQQAADEMVDSKWYNQVGDRSVELVEMMRST